MNFSKLLLSGFALTAILVACSSQPDKTVTRIKHGTETEYRVHLKEVTDTLSLKLSDFATDFEFVPLETKNECLLEWGKYYVGTKYILVEVRDRGILQFARDGKFIRTLVLIGEGPKEFMEARWTVDENNQILIIADRRKRDYFLRFDLKSGENLEDLKMAIPGRSQGAVYLKEDRLTVVPAGLKADSKDFCFLYTQDLAGNLISTVPAQNVSFLDWNSLSYSGQDDLYRFKPGFCDTLFSVVNNQLVPFVTFDFGEKNPPDNSHIGRQNLHHEMEVGSWVFFYNHHITRMDHGQPSGPVLYYVLDKKTGKFYHRGPIYFNPTHQSFSINRDLTFMGSKGLIVHQYSAVNLLEQSEKAFADPEFKEPYRSKLKELVNQLTVEDNPVLLIGRYK